MRIGAYEFEGPFDSIEDLEDSPGLGAVVNVRDTGVCLLVGVRYATNVRESIASIVSRRCRRERAMGGRLRFGVRYVGGDSEAELRQAMTALKSQYLVTCIL